MIVSAAYHAGQRTAAALGNDVRSIVGAIGLNADQSDHKTLHGASLKRVAGWFQHLPDPVPTVRPKTTGQSPDNAGTQMRSDKLGEHRPSSEAFDLKWLREQAGRKDEVDA